MKKIVVLSVLVVVVALAAVVAGLVMRSSAETDGTSPKAHKTQETALKDAISRAKSLMAKNPKAAAKGSKRRLKFGQISYEERTDLSPVEKRQLSAIQSALDAEDLKALLAVLPEASKSPNVEVRSEMVDALGWFGEEAMLELLPFMADRNEEVAEAAMDSWTMSLGEIENEKEKATLIESAMLVLRDTDGLESMVMELSDCDDLVAMQSVLNLIEGPNPKAARVAREHYEFMTGEAYAGFEAAEQWMRENYEIDNADGSASTLAEREAARAVAAKSSSARRASATSSSRRRSSSSRTARVAASGEGAASGDAGAEGVADAEGAAEETGGGLDDDPESKTDEIIGDSNKLLEAEGEPGDGEADECVEELDDDGNPVGAVPPPAQ